LGYFWNWFRFSICLLFRNDSIWSLFNGISRLIFLFKSLSLWLILCLLSFMNYFFHLKCVIFLRTKRLNWNRERRRRWRRAFLLQRFFFLFWLWLDV
jgi:hypothetical protein